MKDIASNTIFSIYLLYPIDRDDEASFYRLLQNYMNIGVEVFAYLIDWEKMDGLPKCRMYVPADHEVFIHSAYKSGFLTKEQISSVNCKIIENCDLLILFGGRTHNKRYNPDEVNCAEQNKVPIYTMPDLSPMAIDALKLSIKLIIKSED